MSSYDMWLAKPCEEAGQPSGTACPDCGEEAVTTIRRGRVVWGWECSECGAYDIEREVEP